MDPSLVVQGLRWWLPPGQGRRGLLPSCWVPPWNWGAQLQSNSHYVPKWVAAVMVRQFLCSWILGKRSQWAAYLAKEQKGCNGKAHNRRRYRYIYTHTHTHPSGTVSTEVSNPCLYTGWIDWSSHTLTPDLTLMLSSACLNAPWSLN